jgi:hypothetical protein
MKFYYNKSFHFKADILINLQSLFKKSIIKTVLDW